MTGLGLYLHLPFCRSRCGYCAFVSVAGRPDLWDPYVDAVLVELALARDRLGPAALQTVYLGGGTPSLLGESRLARLLTAVTGAFVLAADAEVTIEANPGTIDAAALAAFRRMGCNRLSLGVQSLADAELAVLGRTHTAAQAVTAIDEARSAGFDNLSLDLIFSIPGSTQDTWSSTLEQALSYHPEHLSAYGLTVEEGTTLAAQVRDHRLEPVDEDQDAEVFALTSQRLTAAGYDHYEVSNYALPGRRCRHNWGYWSGVEYLGLGASAHSYLAGRRSWNTSDVDAYVARLRHGEVPETEGECIDADTARRERLWLGLRTDAGVALEPAEWQALAASPRLRQLADAGFVALQPDRLRLTRLGLALADGLSIEVAEVLERRVWR